jgi:hypothetical protein
MRPNYVPIYISLYSGSRNLLGVETVMKIFGLVMIWSSVLRHCAILKGARDKNKE